MSLEECKKLPAPDSSLGGFPSTSPGDYQAGKAGRQVKEEIKAYLEKGDLVNPKIRKVEK